MKLQKLFFLKMMLFCVATYAGINEVDETFQAHDGIGLEFSSPSEPAIFAFYLDRNLSFNQSGVNLLSHLIFDHMNSNNPLRNGKKVFEVKGDRIVVNEEGFYRINLNASVKAINLASDKKLEISVDLSVEKKANSAYYLLSSTLADLEAGKFLSINFHDVVKLAEGDELEIECTTDSFSDKAFFLGHRKVSRLLIEKVE